MLHKQTYVASSTPTIHFSFHSTQGSLTTSSVINSKRYAIKVHLFCDCHVSVTESVVYISTVHTAECLKIKSLLPSESMAIHQKHSSYEKHFICLSVTACKLEIVVILHVNVVWLGKDTSKGKGHPCTGTEALYSPYGP